MPLPTGLTYLLAWPFLTDRMDVWVLIGSAAFLLACIAGLGLWHVVAFLLGKLPKKPRKVKDSTESPSAIQSPKPPKHAPTQAEAAPTGDDPERLQQACTALEDSLAEAYMALADSWMRNGQPAKEAAALKKIIQICPGSRQAQLAQDRVLQIGTEGADHHS